MALIIDERIRSLAERIESGEQTGATLKRISGELFRALESNLPKSRHLGLNFPSPSFSHGNYPMDGAFALAFDPLTEEEAFLDAWRKHGMVVGAGIRQPSCNAFLSRLEEMFKALGMNPAEPATWPKDDSGQAILDRGFFEIYHDAALASLRQNIRIYIHHALLWGSARLWTSFDRIGVKPPEGASALGLALHVDQNPAVHPGFQTIQGVLALEDCPEDGGTFVAVPGSAEAFSRYQGLTTADYQGEFIALDPASALHADLFPRRQAIPMRAGNFVSWDSRATHGNAANTSGKTRKVVYLSTGLAKEGDQEISLGLPFGEGASLWRTE